MMSVIVSDSSAVSIVLFITYAIYFLFVASDKFRQREVIEGNSFTCISPSRELAPFA